MPFPDGTVYQEPTSNPVRCIVYLLLLLVLTGPSSVYGLTTTVTIELDHALLRQLLIKQLFNTTNLSAEILSDPSGCSSIVLSNPQVDGKRLGLEIVTEVEAHIGVAILGGCRELLQWKGNAGLVGRPVIEPGETAVRLEPIDSWLVAADGEKVTSGKIWELTHDQIRSQFRRYTLDLQPTIDTLRMVLRDVLPRRSTQQMQEIIASLRLSDIQVSTRSLDVSLSFDVGELAVQPEPEAALSPAELRQWETRWQRMDALLTFAVKYYASATPLQELRNALLEVLLDSRYRLRDALTIPASRADDPVRHWFLDSWKRLSPIVRRIGLEQSGQEHLLWVSLLTATDALRALDQFGPAIGLEISTEGLRRLARLIDSNTGVDPLLYQQGIDADLQRLLQLPATPASERPSGFLLNFWPIRSAWAGTSTDLLDRWVPGKDQLPEYLPLIASLIKTTAEKTQIKSKLEKSLAKLFRKLVLATAWQESCWRQYVMNEKKIEPLRSSTGDVGLMQINEKIWRGFYDIQKLRWDIAYNAQAGTEILLNYFVRYALKRGEQKRAGGIDNLARASYSAYNGGPGQFSRYRSANVAAAQKSIDAAFWEKYQLVKAGKELLVAECLGLEQIDLPKLQATTNTAEKVEKQIVAAGDSGAQWVLAQNEHHFTLQLAVFSQRGSAQEYIAQLSLTGPARIYPIRKKQATQFTVLYGSYAHRSDADQEKRTLRHLKPWIRQFADLRKAGKPTSAR